MKITITINVNPIIVYWCSIIAYAWNELIHWGMNQSAPMYNSYVIRKQTLKEMMK